MFQRKKILAMLGLILWSPLSLSAAGETPAKGGQEPTVQTDTTPSVSPQPAGGGSEILFFPEQSPRPSSDRFKVQAGQEVPLCIKLRPGKSPVLEEILQRATGFRLILEDNQEPPNAIVVSEGGDQTRLVLDEQGCFRSTFQIPPQADAGVYQVADLLFLTTTQTYISVRENLYSFSQANELDVVNENQDQKGPELVSIGTFQDQVRKIAKHADFMQIQVKQSFIFRDDVSGIDPKSIRVFYRLIENGHEIEINEAYCKKVTRQKGKFHCKLKLIRPNIRWSALTPLSLEIESVYLKDRAGNSLLIRDSKVFAEKAQGSPIEFQFEEVVKAVPRKVKYKNRHPNRLRSGS